IARFEIDPAEQRPDDEAAPPWLSALEKAAERLSTITESFEQIRQQCERASERLSKAPPSEGEGVGSPASSRQAVAPPDGPLAVTTNGVDLRPLSNESIPSAVEMASGPPGPSLPEAEPLAAPSTAAEPAIADETIRLAAQLDEMARRFLHDQTSASAIHESLTSAVELMTQTAAQVASQAEVQELAGQVEALRGAVNNLQSRVTVSRAG